MLRWKGLQELGATCAAIATMLLVCGGALGETGSKIQAEAKKADRAGAHDRAIELYSTALSDASTSDAGRRDILKARAYLNERVKQIDRALEDWTSAIAIEPVAPRLYASRGFFYLRQRRYDDALADFAKGAALDEKSPIYAYGVGELHFDRLQYADAVSAYTKAIALDGQHTTSYLGRGLAHLQQDNLRDAQADFERVIALRNPLLPSSQGKLYLGLGWVKMRNKEYTLALSDLDKGLGIMPNNLNGLSERAFVLEQLGDRNRALEDYNRILALKADDSRALERRSKLLAR